MHIAYTHFSLPPFPTHTHSLRRDPVEPVDVCLLVGDTVEFMCVFTSISELNTTTSIQTPDGTEFGSNLIIETVSGNDGGNYSCSFIDPVCGPVVETFEVQVYGEWWYANNVLHYISIFAMYFMCVCVLAIMFPFLTQIQQGLTAQNQEFLYPGSKTLSQGQSPVHRLSQRTQRSSSAPQQVFQIHQRIGGGLW